MPEYDLLPADEGRGLLPWSWAAERLVRSHNYWFASTRPDGRPHVMPIWGLWLDDVFYFSTAAHSQKARNLHHNTHCVVTAEDAAESVIVEGQVRLIDEPAMLARVADAYLAKYEEGYPDDSLIYAVHPHVAFGFIEGGGEFTATATRWRFD